MAADARQRALSKMEVKRIIDNELTDEYENLRWTPGFCLDVVEWDRLKELIRENTEQSLGQLGRHPKDIAVYWTFRRKMLEMYASMADFVKISKLDFAASANTGNGLIEAGKPPPDIDGRPHITWHQNDFPYNFEEGVEHHNIWCTRPLSDEDIEQVIAANRQGWETLYFRNPESLASIPDVWHGHVVSRMAST